MSSALYHFSALQYDNLIAIANGAQPMGDNQASAAPAPQTVIDCLFGVWIQSAGGFIENQDARPARQSARAISSR